MDPQPAPPSTSLPSTNPPSVEEAYKRKCIALKKRLNEIESENEIVRLRNRRGWQYIHKMRLESCILLERLATFTGMPEETAKAHARAQMEDGDEVGQDHAQDHAQGPADEKVVDQGLDTSGNPESETKATPMFGATVLNDSAARATGDDEDKNGNGTGNGNGNGNAKYVEDETEGSSDDQPLTPQERPLRLKRPQKPEVNADDNDIPPSQQNNDNDTKNNTLTEQATGGGDGGGLRPSFPSPSTLPRLAPAPSQEDMTSSFRIHTDNNNNNNNDSHDIHGDTESNANGNGNGLISDGRDHRRHSDQSHNSHKTEFNYGPGGGNALPSHGEEAASSSFTGQHPESMDVDSNVKEES